jgi:hypothetical protein
MPETQYPMIPLDLLYYLIWQMRQRQAQQAARTRQQPGVQIESGGGTDSTGDGPGMSGSMTDAERATLSAIAGGPVGWGSLTGAYDNPTGIAGGVAKTVANTALGAGLTALGSTMPNPASVLSMIGNLTLGLDKSIKSLFGPQEQVAVAPTEADLQSASDKFGFGMPTGFGVTAGMPGLGGVTVGPRGTGTTGPSDDRTTPEAPSVTNPESLGGSVDAGQSDTAGTADSTGGSRGGTDGPDRKRGGVFRASRPKTERITWGERGTAPGGRSGETAIFIPDRFQLPGLQDNERVVRSALRRSLSDILEGRRRSQG